MRLSFLLATPFSRYNKRTVPVIMDKLESDVEKGEQETNSTDLVSECVHMKCDFIKEMVGK